MFSLQPGTVSFQHDEREPRSPAARRRAVRRPQSQTGAALLVFMLLVIVAASTMLVNRLNATARYSIYSSESGNSLGEARDAVIAWAVSHPTNPGTLPMPDRNGDGNYDGDADCSNGAIGSNLLIGRLPWRSYPSPCKDAASLNGIGALAFDSSGEQLWYAVSKNLVYESPDYPVISPGLLSRTDGWITVRDANASVLSDRVAFVIIAPGASLPAQGVCGGVAYSAQNRGSTAPDIGNYLDNVTISSVLYSNADFDQDFIAYSNSLATNGTSDLERCDRFNDQLLFVTIDELVEKVGKRALNEAANALSAYREANGALPWLAPFADPKSEARILSRTATESNDNLVDDDPDDPDDLYFTEWNVTAGDTVWNLTDGSMGIVTAVSSNSLTIGGGLKFGTNNTFSAGNKYFVDVRYMPDSLIQTASPGSTGTLLKDSGRNFELLGILPGDVIENVTDGSAGIISSVDGDEIVAAAMTGGTGNDFASGDTYRIRTNSSRVTSNTANLTLIDANVDFVAMGVQTGDIVHNLWDQAIGRVTTVNSPTQLQVDVLKLGTGTVFNANEPYQISRYNGNNGTRIGLLPLHQRGEIMPTGFSMDWYSPNSGGSVTTSLATDTTYTGALANYAGASSGYSGTVTVDAADAKCTWIGHEFVRCKGTYEDTNADFLAGTATSGSSSLALRDTNKDFSALGAKRGDKVRNLTDGTTGIVFNVSSTQLTLANIYGSSVGISVGDDYEIDLATSSFTFNAAANSTASAWQYRVYYPGTVNESLLAVGDTIENMNGSQSVGRISSINTFSNYIVYTRLQGGGYEDIYDNEPIRIRHNFVSKRQYEFDVTFKGTSVAAASGGVRTRTVCKGYDASCTTAANSATLKGDGTTAFVTIRDYEGTTEVGRATNTLPVTGLDDRSLKVSGLEFYLDDEYGDLPEWFVRNKWYQYLTVAYSDGDAPGGSTCTAGTNCLTLNIRDTANGIVSTKNNVRALLMLSGQELPSQSWADSLAADYFDEAGNTNLTDEVFDRRPQSDTFNDLIRLSTSCPAPNSDKLCWSQ